MRPTLALLALAMTLFGCEDKDEEPFRWHYKGPADRAEITKQAVDLLTDDCIRLMVDRKNMEYFNVNWTVLRMDRKTTVNTIEVWAKLKSDFRPRFAGNGVHAGDDVRFLMVGGSLPGYTLMGTAAHYYCDTEPPIGASPVSLKPQPRLAPLDF